MLHIYMPPRKDRQQVRDVQNQRAAVKIISVTLAAVAGLLFTVLAIHNGFGNAVFFLTSGALPTVVLALNWAASPKRLTR